MNRFGLVSAWAVAAVLGPTAFLNAALLYSIDALTDELVTIDTTTGSVAVIGATGHNMVDVGLTFLDGKLFALNDTAEGATAPAAIELIRLNHLTGAVEEVVIVTLDGADLMTTAAEDITAVDGTLLAAFRTDFGDPVHSNMLADLATTGELINVDDFSVFGADFDCVATDVSGQLYSVDAGDAPSNLYSVDRSPALEYTLLNSLSPHAANEVVFTESALFALARSASLLHRIDPVTAEVLESIGLDSDGTNLLGLAYRPRHPADLNDDGMVDASDLALLLGTWGPTPGHPADINGDTIVNGADLAALLGAWGPV